MSTSRLAVLLVTSLLSLTSLCDVIDASAQQQKVDDGGIDPGTSFDTSSGRLRTRRFPVIHPLGVIIVAG